MISRPRRNAVRISRARWYKSSVEFNWPFVKYCCGIISRTNILAITKVMVIFHCYLYNTDIMTNWTKNDSHFKASKCKTQVENYRKNNHDVKMWKINYCKIYQPLYTPYRTGPWLLDISCFQSWRSFPLYSREFPYQVQAAPGRGLALLATSIETGGKYPED